MLFWLSDCIMNGISNNYNLYLENKEVMTIDVQPSIKLGGLFLFYVHLSPNFK